MMNLAERALQSATCRAAKREYHWTDEELFAALRQVAASRGRCTTGTYVDAYYANEVGPCSRTFELRFGSWANALDAAGLPTRHPAPYSNRIPNEDLWAAVVECGEETGGIPTVAQYDRWARAGADRPCAATVRQRLGGWGTVIRVLGGTA